MASAVFTVGVIGSIYYAYHRYQDRKNVKLSKNWIHIGHLKQLYAFPIKSCAPVLLNHAECSPLGLRDGWLRDRIMMITDYEDNMVVTAKTYPEMLRIKSNFDKAILTLEHPKMQPIAINLVRVALKQKLKQATLWENKIWAYDCGEEVNTWITECLGNCDSKFRLVYYASETSRAISQYVKMWPNIHNTFRYTDSGAFSDEIMYHVINEASIEDLNSRLNCEDKVTDLHFRPNFLISGYKPFDEDKWKFVKIGENIFEVIKPSSRCCFLTINPETAERNKNMEPLVTLRRYRLAKQPEVLKVLGNAPLMGIHMALRSGPGGIVSVNEPVYVSY